VRETVIVGAVRTPIGRFGGAYKDLTAQDLASRTIKEVLSRTHLDPALVDEVIFGCIVQGSDAANIARVAALMAGMPVEVPAYTVQRNCASGQAAITCAVQAIQAGDGDIYMCGGVESMSTAPYVVRGARWGLRMRHSTLIDSLWEGLTDPICDQMMGRTAENLAEQYGVSREEQDSYAVASHRKAFMATRSGRFGDEILPIEVKKCAAGQEVASELITQDECINPALTVQKAALYPTVFKENGTVTPANSCPISDGAAACLVMTAEKAKELDMEPMAYVRGYAYAGVDPSIMGIGPVYAAPKALARANVTLSDVDLVELNEAFAAQVLAVGKGLDKEGWDWDKVNVNGGAIALGHPVGCTGCRIVVTLLHEMQKRDLSLGLAMECVGGGQGAALVLERK
jgi:acetyl-CoA C-acetyltransferase